MALTNFMLLVSFYTPKNITKPVVFIKMFFRVIEKDHSGVNGTKKLICIPIILLHIQSYEQNNLFPSW